MSSVESLLWCFASIYTSWYTLYHVIALVVPEVINIPAEYMIFIMYYCFDRFFKGLHPIIQLQAFSLLISTLSLIYVLIPAIFAWWNRIQIEANQQRMRNYIHTHFALLSQQANVPLHIPQRKSLGLVQSSSDVQDQINENQNMITPMLEDQNLSPNHENLNIFEDLNQINDNLNLSVSKNYMHELTNVKQENLNQVHEQSNNESDIKVQDHQILDTVNENKVLINDTISNEVNLKDEIEFEELDEELEWFDWTNETQNQGDDDKWSEWKQVQLIDCEEQIDEMDHIYDYEDINNFLMSTEEVDWEDLRNDNEL